MRRARRLLALAALAAAPARAAELAYDAALAANDQVRSGSLGLARRHPLWDGRLLAGYGARLTAVGGRLELVPARQAQGSSTLTVDDAFLAMLNASVHAALVPTKATELGFNLDVAGLSAGASGSAAFRPHPSAAPTSVGASPARANLFLWGVRDRGSLNSEFYAAWSPKPSLTLRAGLSHLLVEYFADSAPSVGTRRFRRFSNLFFVGQRWRP